VLRSGFCRLTGLSMAVMVLALSAATAQAGPPGSWTQVTGIGGGVTGGEEIGLERTSDGRLHVAWSRTGASAGLFHSALSTDARSVSGPDLIYAPTFGLNNRVDLVAGPGGGLRAFFGSLSSAAFSDRMGTATSARDGRTWAVQPTPASNGTPGGGSPVYPASGISGLLGNGGVPISIWGDSAPGAGGYHVGVDPAGPDTHFTTGCCTIDPNGARETGTGRTFYAWNRLGATRTSSVVQEPGQPPREVPNSQAAQLGHRLAITGRIGHRGVYVAYSAGQNSDEGRPALWRVGEPAPLYFSDVRGARHTSLAPTPGGHIWVMWARQGRIFAGRTSPRGTQSGHILSVTPPRGTVVIRNLTGEASRGPLDLLAFVDRGPQGSGYWHQRVLPSLAVSVSPDRIPVRGGRVTVRVTDSGTAIDNALVTTRIGGVPLRARTGRDGRVTFQVPSSVRGVYGIRANAPGFSEGVAGLRLGG
jgi:hypothetical protein